MPDFCQDSLLEITLRARVIEKLSVALHECLFVTQDGQGAMQDSILPEVRTSGMASLCAGRGRSQSDR